MTSRDVRERDTRSSTLIAALPAIDRARQRFFNWQEKIRIVAVARLCYPGVRDEPFPLRKKSLNTRLCGDASRFLLGPLAGGKKKDLLRLLNPRHRVAVHEVER